MNYLLSILFFIAPLFSTDKNGVELPIGLTEEEKGKMHIIEEMGRETDPPPTPIRNISEFETLQNNYDNNRIRLLRGDVTDRKSLEKVRIDSEKIWDSVDIIVNNAGIDTPPNEGKNYKINEINRSA